MPDELVELIEDFRAELEAEIPRRLHPSPPPGSKGTKGMPAGDMGGLPEPAGPYGEVGWSGLPFHPAFQRYLGHSEDYGYQFIAAASFDAIRDFCREEHHESHLEPQPTGSRCRRIAVAVVELRQPLAFVAAQEGIGPYAARQDLIAVLRYAAKWRGRKRGKAVAHDTAEEPMSLATTLRRQHNETHEQIVWERLRRKYPHPQKPGESLLPDWDVEQSRRLEQHRKLGCPECMTRAA